MKRYKKRSIFLALPVLLENFKSCFQQYIDGKLKIKKKLLCFQQMALHVGEKFEIQQNLFKK